MRCIYCGDVDGPWCLCWVCEGCLDAGKRHVAGCSCEDNNRDNVINLYERLLRANDCEAWGAGRLFAPAMQRVVWCDLCKSYEMECKCQS